MLSVIGSLIGLGGSVVPQIFKAVNDHQDRKQELEVMRLQIEAQKQGREQRAEEIRTEAQSRETVARITDNKPSDKSAQWVHNLRDSVRPFVTYFFMMILLITLVAAVMAEMRQAALANAIVSVYVAMGLEAMISAVVMFWFGDRAFNKKR